MDQKFLVIRPTLGLSRFLPQGTVTTFSHHRCERCPAGSHGQARPPCVALLLHVEGPDVLRMWQPCSVQSHWLYVLCLCFVFTVPEQPPRTRVFECLDFPLRIGNQTPRFTSVEKNRY